MVVLNHMMMMLLLVLCFSATVFVRGQSPCVLDNVPLQQDFDIEKFVGKWYEVEWIAPAYQDAGLLWINYYHVYTKDQFGVVTGYSSGKDPITEECFIGGLANLKTPDHPAKLIQYIDGSKMTRDYWVMDTDYTSYATVYSCVERSQVNNSECATARSWLWGRLRSLPEQVKVNARSTFESLCMNMTLLYVNEWRGDDCVPDVSDSATGLQRETRSWQFVLMSSITLVYSALFR